VSADLTGLRVFDLEQPRWPGAPMHPSHVPPGFAYLLHRRHEPQAVGPDGRSGSAGTLITSDHAGTHIDALCHQAVDLKLCGGVDAGAIATSFGYAELGVDTIEPIVARGWLIDLGVVEPDRWIGLEEVKRAADAQGVKPGRGDVVLARTGNGVHWHDQARYLRGSGMKGEVSQWLADAGVGAVGADNMAWDLVSTDPEPDLGITLPGHVILLVRSGIYILENLFLEQLAGAGVHEFTFVCTPLKIRGATGSPVRPLALAATG
jgi:kynurenine formamidase